MTPDFYIIVNGRTIPIAGKFFKEYKSRVLHTKIMAYQVGKKFKLNLNDKTIKAGGYIMYHAPYNKFIEIEEKSFTQMFEPL